VIYEYRRCLRLFLKFVLSACLQINAFQVFVAVQRVKKSFVLRGSVSAVRRRSSSSLRLDRVRATTRWPM
jgi:hypothetical protein